VRLVRRAASADDEFSWDPPARTIDGNALDGVDAVVNLTGANIGRIPWTPAYKRSLLTSRIDTTQTLAEAIAVASTPPSVFVAASAVGFYGDRPGEVLDESAAKGEGYIPDIVDAWEKAANIASPVTRVVNLRTGLIMARSGALKPMAFTTRLGLGARFGSGQQHWPWVSLHDEAAAIHHLLTSKLSGPVNVAGPTPATAEDVSRSLARVLHRWHPLVIPRAAITLGLGEAGQELLLNDQEQVSTKLLADGFEFAHKTVDSAIEAAFS
jgi:uncharacterized protein (TIGR01777 family)